MDTQTMNLRLLTVLMMRDLTARDLCAVTGYSRAYISKCLKGTVTPSNEFWGRLNDALHDGKLNRFLGRLFQVEATEPSEVVDVLAGIDVAST